MLRLIEQMRQGSVNPCVLNRTEHSRKINKFGNSRMKTLRGLHLHRGHRGYREIRCLEPDSREGKYLLVALGDGGILLYNVEDNDISKHREINPMKTIVRRQNGGSGHKKSVERVEWYPHDCKLFASASLDKRFKLWDGNQMKVVDEVETPKGINSFHFSPIPGHQSAVAIAMDMPKIVLFDIRSMKNSQELSYDRFTKGALSVCWSSIDNNLLASAGSDPTVFLWDVRKHKSPVLCIDLNTDDDDASSGDSDTNIHLNRAEFNVRHPNYPVSALKFVCNGTNLLTYSKNGIKLWNPLNGEDLGVDFGKLPGQGAGIVKSVQIGITEESSPPHLFVPKTSSIQVHNLYTGIKLKTIGGHTGHVTCCSYNRVNMELYSAGLDGSIKVWRNNEEYAESHAEQIGPLPPRLFIGFHENPGSRYLLHSTVRPSGGDGSGAVPPPATNETERGGMTNSVPYIRIRHIQPSDEIRPGFVIGEIRYDREDSV